MTDKPIIIDYENLCENYSKEVGCYNTFDGSCIKEQCFTYRLLQLLKAKEQECEELKRVKDDFFKHAEISHEAVLNKNKIIDEQEKQLDQLKADREEALKQLEFVRTLNTIQEAEIRKLSKTIAEIKEIAENSCCLLPTSDCEEYGNCKECRRISDDKTVQQILQKISEYEVRDDKSNR